MGWDLGRREKAGEEGFDGAEQRSRREKDATRGGAMREGFRGTGEPIMTRMSLHAPGREARIIRAAARGGPSGPDLSLLLYI